MTLFLQTLPYLAVFAAARAATLALTPLVRELARRAGMVDKPDARRINRAPVPRGGGIAIVVGVFATYPAIHFLSGRPLMQSIADGTFHQMSVLAAAVSLLGLADDRYSLKPRWKLLGQVVIAFAVWAWAGLGFRTLWPDLPTALDCVLTVFWIVGAVNAFNLIDGLDGLASGISLIAVVGLGGSLFFTRNPQANLFYFALAGGILGFLRYNWHPASVFLGDAGSMFLGFMVSTLPLASQEPNSFLVSVGVPMLAMGVPILDTALAILRRTLRRLLGGGAKGEVMTADADHLHHRILRASGLNQRKAAFILYAAAAALVATGIVAMYLESRAAGLWLAVFAVGSVVLFKDSYIELFEAGRLAATLAHPRTRKARRLISRLTLPCYLICDLLLLAGGYLFCCHLERLLIDLHVLRTFLLVRVSAVFFFLVLFRAYRTIWSRAMLSNFVRLAVACFLGSALGSTVIYYWPSLDCVHVRTITLSYALLSFAALAGLRILRGLVRDLFYAIDCNRLKARRDVSRLLVYGGGLRYEAFRRELVRRTAANDRMIVGILDDDIFLRNRYIGGIKVHGTIQDAPAVIDALNADQVVITCEIADDWRKVVMDILRPTGVKVSQFTLSETLIEGDSK